MNATTGLIAGYKKKVKDRLGAAKASLSDLTGDEDLREIVFGYIVRENYACQSQLVALTEMALHMPENDFDRAFNAFGALVKMQDSTTLGLLEKSLHKILGEVEEAERLFNFAQAVINDLSEMTGDLNVAIIDMMNAHAERRRANG